MSSEILTSTIQAPTPPGLRLLEPPPSSKRPRTRLTLLVGLAAVLAVLVTGVSVYQWQHGRTTTPDQGPIVSRLQAQLADRDRQISALYDRLLIHGRQIDQLTARIESLQVRHQGSKTELQAVQAQLDKARADLASAQRQLSTWVGSPLADGVYTGVLYAPDDADDPHRIAMYVIDDSKGNVLSDRGWRVLEVTPGAVVRLTTPPGGPATKDFGTFVELWSHGDPTFAYLHAVGYSITVSGARVTKLVETGEPTWGS
jgi:hypothetical protein